MQKTWFLGVVLFFVLSACSTELEHTAAFDPNSPAAKQKRGQVTGTVQLANEADFSQVAVKLTGSFANYETSTDAQGYYSFDFVIPGEYAITAVSRYFAPYESELQVGIGEAVNLSLITLQPVETVVGGVAKSQTILNGAPVQKGGVFIELLRQRSIRSGPASPPAYQRSSTHTAVRFTTLSDGDGEWQVDGVPSGIYSVSASKDDIPTQTIDEVVVDAEGNVVVDDILLLPMSGFVELEGPSGSPLFTTTQTVTVQITGQEIGKMQFGHRTNGVCNYGAEQTFMSLTQFDLLSQEGLQTVCVRLIGLKGAEAEVFGMITYDGSDPVLALADFAATNGFTTQPQGILQLAAVDAISGLGSIQWSYTETGVTEASYTPWQTSILTPFTPVTTGTKTVWLRVLDRAGNFSSTVSASVTYDHDAPILGSLQILGEGGEPVGATNSSRLLLALEAADPDKHPLEMMISSRIDFYGAVWQPYVTAFAWDVAAPADAEGASRSVYAKVRDAAGRLAEGFRSDSVHIDTVAPVEGTAVFALGSTRSVDNAELVLGGADWDYAQVAFDLTFAAAVSVNASPALIDLKPADGRQVVYVRFRDNSGNAASPVAAEILVDRTAPLNASFKILTSSPTNVLSLALALDAVDAAEFRINEGVTCTSPVWLPYTQSHGIAIAEGEGWRNFSVQYRDAADNRTDCLTDSIEVDRVKPVVASSPSFSSGSVTKNNLTTLVFNVSEAASMRVSENIGFTGAGWEPYSANKTFLLSEGDGTKTVFAEFRDAAGNVTGPVSATIELDASAPSNVSLTSVALYVTTSTVSLSLSADGVPTQMMLSEQLGFAGATEEPFNAAPVWPLSGVDGEKLLYVKVRDAAGNWSAASSVRVIADTVAPSDTSLMVNGGAVLTKDSIVQVSLSAVGADEVEVSGDIVNGSTGWLAVRSSVSVQLSAGDGPKTVRARWRDRAGWYTPYETAVIELDKTAPGNGSVSIDGGALVNSAVQDLTITQLNAVDMMVSNNSGFIGGVWEPVATSKQWALSAGDGLKTVFVKFRDEAGNESLTPAQDSATLDSVAPTGVSFTIGAGAATSTRVVTLNLSAVDATHVMSANDPSFAGADWRDFGASVTHEITAGDGLKVVYLKYRDAALNETAVLSQVVTLDTGSPTGPEILINGGAAYTTSLSVTLNLNAADATLMAFSPDNSVYSNWEAYSPSAAYLLSGTDATKTVWVKFRDGAGNETVSVNDTIALDRSAPTGGSVVIDSAATYTLDQQVVLSIGVSGAYQMQVAEADSFAGASWEPVAATRLFTLTGSDGPTPKPVYVRFRDEAGHVTAAVSDSIVWDQSPPVLLPPAVSLENGAAAANTNEVAITLRYVDAVAAVVAEDISLNFPIATLTLPGGGIYSTTVTLAAGEGNHTVYVKFFDAAGNAIIQSDGILVDTTAPSGVSIRIDDDALYSTSVAGSVQLALSGADGLSGIAKMRLSNTNGDGNLDGAAEQPYSSSLGWTLASPGAGIDASRSVYVQLIDAAGNPSAIATDAIQYDTFAPFAAAVQVDGGSLYSRSTSVQLSLSASGAPVSMIVGNDSGFVGRSFEPYSTTRSWLLASGGDGVGATVYVRYRDAAGNLSPIASDGITVDTVAPSNPALALDGGAEYLTPSASYTQDESVEATATAVGWATVELSEDVSFLMPLVTLPAATVMPFPVTFTAQPDGTRTLYARFLDEAGNASPVIATAITKDGAAPKAPKIVLNDGDTYSSSNTLSLELGATDNLSGLEMVELAADSSFSTGVASYAYNASLLHTIAATPDGLRTVWARFIDRAGNVSASASDWIVLDTAAPIANSILLNRGKSYASSNLLLVEVDAADLTPMEMQLSENADFSGASWVSYQSPISYTVGLLNGTKTVYFKVRDALGTQSTPVLSDSLVLDTTPPSAQLAAFPWPATNTLNAAIDVAAEDNLGGAIYVKFVGTGLASVDGASGNVGTYVPIGDGNFNLAFYTVGAKAVYVTFSDAAENESYALRANLTIDQAGPVQTVSLLVAQGANKRASLSWSKVNDAGYYVVESMKGYAGGVFTPDGPGTVINDTTGVLAGLENGYNYGFRVRSYDSVGNPDASWSNILTTTVGVVSRSIDQQGELNAIRGIAMDGNTVHLVTANGTGLWEYRRSQDNGRTWTRKILGGQATASRDAEIEAGGGRVVIAAKERNLVRIFSSVDGGESFVTHTLADFNTSAWPDEEIGLAMDGKVVLLVGARGTGYAVRRSKNGALTGGTWEPVVSMGTADSNLRRTDVCMKGPLALHVYLDANHYVRARYSKNGGFSWADVNVGGDGDDIDTIRANVYDNVRCEIDNAGNAYVLYREQGTDSNLVLAFSHDLQNFIRRTVGTGKTPAGALIDLHSPSLWVSDSNRIFVAAHDVNSQTLWLLDSYNSGYDWKMTQLDSNLTAGLHNAMTGSGKEDYRIVYDLDDKQSIRFLTPDLPAPAQFEAKPTYDINKIVTRWAAPFGQNDFIVSSGYSATLGNDASVSGDTLTLTGDFNTHAVASKDAYGTGNLSNLFVGDSGYGYFGTISGFWGNNIRGAAMALGADQTFIAVAFDDYVRYASIDDGRDATNWQTVNYSLGNTVYCVDLAVDDFYIYVVYGTQGYLYFKRFDFGTSTWSAAVTLWGSNAQRLTSRACGIAVKDTLVRVVGISTLDGLEVVKSGNRGASWSTGVFVGNTAGNGVAGPDIQFDPTNSNSQIIGYTDWDLSNTPIVLTTTNDWGAVSTVTGFSGEGDIAVAAYDNVGYTIIGDEGRGPTYFGYGAFGETSWTTGSIDPSSGRVGGLYADEKGLKTSYLAEDFSVRVASCVRDCTLPTGWTVASVHQIDAQYDNYPLFVGTPGNVSYGVINENGYSPFFRLWGRMWQEAPNQRFEQSGLVGHYYKGSNFSSYYVGNRIDPVLDFNWGTGAAISGGWTNSFSVIWTGWIRLNAGFYRWCSTYDDAVRLKVGGQLLLDEWADTGANSVVSATWFQAVSFGYFPIEFQYRDISGSASVKLQYSQWTGSVWGACTDIPQTWFRY